MRKIIETTEPKTGERIAKVIARAGICSRRDAERLIAEGRVALEGQRVRISGPQGDAARTLSSPAVDEP